MVPGRSASIPPSVSHRPSKLTVGSGKNDRASRHPDVGFAVNHQGLIGLVDRVLLDPQRGPCGADDIHIALSSIHEGPP